MSAVPVVLREMGDADRNYVLSSWLMSYGSKGKDSRTYESPADFRADYVHVIQSLLARSRVVVAGLEEQPDIIVAWMAWEGDMLHYIAVKPAFRRLGVARSLLQDFASMPVVYTHRTTDSQRCPVPSCWAYRRYRIWPAREAA